MLLLSSSFITVEVTALVCSCISNEANALIDAVIDTCATISHPTFKIVKVLSFNLLLKLTDLEYFEISPVKCIHCGVHLGSDLFVFF